MTPATLPGLTDANALTDWLVDAVPGERAVYHLGHLAADIAPTSRTLSPEQRRERAVLADAAWRLCERGVVHLVQQRVADGACAYLVVARRRVALLADRANGATPHVATHAPLPAMIFSKSSA
jgi:uncharacterized membrane protein